MPRIRYIKPEFFKDEDLAQLQPLFRLAFAGLWCYADKAGRLKDRPQQLKVEILPYDEINFEDVLNKLAKSKPINNNTSFITRYSVDNEKYIQINKFSEHQKPHHTEKESVIPPLTVKKPLKPKIKRMEKGMGMEKQKELSRELKNGDLTVKDFIGKYCSSFKALYGKNPIISPKYSGIAKRLIDIPEIDLIMERFFKSKDPFVIQNCHSMNIIESQLNKLLVSDKSIKVICTYDSNKPCYFDCPGCEKAKKGEK